jgi:hypothetical protein
VTARKLIGDQWRSYAEQIVPADAPKVQMQETRRAFYAGAQALFGVCFEIGGDDVSEDEGLRSLESVREELNRFVDAVKHGRA